MKTANMKPAQYHMVMIGGVARLARPSRTVYPLPAVRCDRKANRYAHVATLPMTRYVLTFP